MEGARYHKGEEAVMHVLCTNASNAPTAPDAAPTYSIYNSAGTALVTNRKMPPVDIGSQVGYFGCGHLLSDIFAEGQYVVLYKYAISSTQYRKDEKFEVMPGGNGGGNCISMGVLRKPHATYVVRQLTSGKLTAGRNPRIT